MEMTVDRAIEVLDLKFDFNAEELKNSYRIMSKKYHPDNISTGNTEKMQEVNEAYWYLVSHISNTSSAYFDVESYKSEKLGWLKKKVRFDKNINDIPYYIVHLVSEVQSYVKSYEWRWRYSNKSEIDNDINLFILPELKRVLRDIKDEFYFKFDINDSRIRGSLNYDDDLETFYDNDLETFYDNLIQIKKTYDRMTGRDIKNSFIQAIDREVTLLFKYRYGYDRLSGLIFEVRSSYIGKIKTFETIDLGVKDFREAILNIFDVMEDYDLKIFELKSICYHINDDKIRNKLEELLNNFERIKSFSVIDRGISELEKLVEEYKYEHDKYKYDKYEHDKLKISEYYRMILNRYISSFELLRGKDASLVNYIFQMSIELMQDVVNGKRDIVDLELLARITFFDYKQDVGVLSKKFGDSFSYIYVINRKIDDIFDNPLLIGKLTNISENTVEMVGYRSSSFKELSLKDVDVGTFKKDYISLEYFLEINEFLGYKYYDDSDVRDYLLYATRYINIYYWKDFSFGFTESKFDFRNLYTNTKTNDPVIQSLEDKNILIEKISEYIEKEEKVYKKYRK